MPATTHRPGNKTNAGERSFEHKGAMVNTGVFTLPLTQFNSPAQNVSRVFCFKTRVA